jgi:leucyl-tRNA synthetase
MIYCETCAKNGETYWTHSGQEAPKDEEIIKASYGWFPVENTDLPIRLPDVEHYEPTDTGESPLANMTEWVETICPVCGKPAKRETDTMPNWAGSDWYYVRYCDPHNDNVIADAEKMKYWLPVDVYVGGDEHNTLHLLYSRFIYKFMYDQGYMMTEEPYFMRMSHGVILGPDNQRMSKSHGNVIVPDDVASRVGVDATRAYLMFMGPFNGTMAWNDSALMGVKRFIDRFFAFVSDNFENFGETDSADVSYTINLLVKNVGKEIEQFGYNSSIAKMMETLNKFEKTPLSEISKETIKSFVVIMSPFIPYAAEELWSQIGDGQSVHSQSWPEVDEAKLILNEIEIPVQINGKVRGTIKISPDADEIVVRTNVEKEESLSKYFEGGQIKKLIYVKGKIVNVIV